MSQLAITVRCGLGESPIHLGVTLLVRSDIPLVNFGLSLRQNQGAVLECFRLLGVLQGVEVVLLVLLDFWDGICDASGILLEAFHVVSLFLTCLRIVLGDVQV